MSSTTDIYASYFYVGMKVGVGIPTHNSETFRDWALIHDLDEDLVFLQLSRDHLPVEASLHVGQILELRGGKEDAGYSCRAIIVSEWTESQILLRLIGEIVTDELREFYRIDAFLPIKYYISDIQNPKELEKEWIGRREQRIAEEIIRKQQPWDSRLITGKSTLPDERHQNTDEIMIENQSEQTDEPDDNSWDTIIPLAANISGGGIRIIAHHEFEAGQYVPLEVLVPTPNHIVDAVAKVISVKPIQSKLHERHSFEVSLKFVNINERDRDAIVNYISNIQLKRIRQLRMQFAFRDSLSEDAVPGIEKYRVARQIVLGLILLSFLVMVAYYMWGYATNRPKHEIEEIFERGIRNYLQQTGR